MPAFHLLHRQKLILENSVSAPARWHSLRYEQASRLASRPSGLQHADHDSRKAWPEPGMPASKVKPYPYRSITIQRGREPHGTNRILPSSDRVSTRNWIIRTPSAELPWVDFPPPSAKPLSNYLVQSQS